MAGTEVGGGGFVHEWIERLAPARRGTRSALDIAVGRGRHAVPLARAGFRTFGVDIRFEAVRGARTAVAAAGGELRAWCADLTRHPLPASRFDLVVVTRYLQRDLFAALAGALRPGGTLLYETFTTAQRALGRGPTSPRHLLEPGELGRAFPDLETVFYEEVAEPEALARLVAQRHA